MGIYTEYPLDKEGNHIFNRKSSDFVQRCNTSVSKSASEIIEVSEDEFKDIIKDSKYEICPQCLRYMQGIVVE